MKCLECGHDLIEMRRELVGLVIDNEKSNNHWQYWKFSPTEYAGHCKNCLCDWEWNEYFDKGNFNATLPTRIFWG